MKNQKKFKPLAHIRTMINLRINIYLSIFLYCTLFLLPGCEHQKERDYLKRFPRIEYGCDYSGFQNNISLKVHLFSKQDSKDYFGTNNFGFNDKVISQGFLPIHINISNDSNCAYTLRPSYLDLLVQPSNRVAKVLHADTYNYVTWLTLPALMFYWQAIPMFVIPMGLNMRRSNQKITENLQHNALQTWKSITISPYETIDKFIFVHIQDFKQSFTLKLFNEDNRKLLTFNVDLVCGVEFLEPNSIRPNEARTRAPKGGMSFSTHVS